jgi:8-oxo-dGTP pyrophosphatase MutT (NUDIX family)
MLWPALQAATASDPTLRVPFVVGDRLVGSVARQHLALLARHAPWIEQGEGRVVCRHPDDTAFAELHAALRAAGAIRAWRDEAFPMLDPLTLAPLARIERAAARFWGTLTLGAHANGYVRDTDGRPSHLWIARRSPHKATDPGLLDNLVGGGVPAGQSPRETLVRESFEEAGLKPAQVQAAAAGSVLRLERDIAEGLQQEWLYSYDLELPAGLEPRNQDGEVAAFTLMAAQEVLRLVQHTGEMTVDAALVTIDFLLRRRLLNEPDIALRLKTLRVPNRSG